MNFIDHLEARLTILYTHNKNLKRKEMNDLAKITPWVNNRAKLKSWVLRSRLVR